jgi:hypothetical protein
MIERNLTLDAALLIKLMPIKLSHDAVLKFYREEKIKENEKRLGEKDAEEQKLEQMLEQAKRR